MSAAPPDGMSPFVGRVFDFVKRPEDLDDLMKQIQGMGKGTQYYVPRG